MVAVVIPIVIVVVAVMMMPMPNHVDPPRHEQRGPVIECAPVWVVDGRPPQDHDPGYIWPRYAETDGDADARLRRRNDNCRGNLGRRRGRRRERHSVTWPGHYCPQGPAVGVNATVAGRPAASVARLLRARRGVPTPSWRKCDDHRPPLRTRRPTTGSTSRRRGGRSYGFRPPDRRPV